MFRVVPRWGRIVPRGFASSRLRSGLADRLAAAFVAEEEEGYNGVLYAKLGYVRKADRNSDLTRRTSADAVIQAKPAA